MSEYGLKINGEIIKKISGPVSFTILKPDIVSYKYLYNEEKEIYDEETGRETKLKRETKLPLIILFGDHHFSLDDRCDPCKNADNCFNIYDEQFLSKLNEISNENHPVEFYAETFNINKSNKNFIYEMRDFMSMFTDEIKDCFDKTDKKEKCKYKNIKWQYADLRNQNEEYVNEKILFLDIENGDKQI